ncbi:MAG: SDR family oxidoreductase [Polyangiaceae bacterium]
MSKRVIITGGSSGIGFGMAKRFLKEGASVVLNARDARKLEVAAAELGHADRVAVLAGAIGDPETGKQLAALAKQRFGGADVLVNNAGIFGVKPFLESSSEELDAFLGTNLKGTYLVTQAVTPLLIEAGGGAIINIGTVLVSQGMTNLPVSAAMASKGGVHALTVSWAAELAKHNIRVNTLAPGIIRTPLIGDNADDFAAAHPLGRIGEVEDTADAAWFLANAPYVTANVLNVDGGYAHGR